MVMVSLWIDISLGVGIILLDLIATPFLLLVFYSKQVLEKVLSFCQQIEKAFNPIGGTFLSR